MWVDEISTFPIFFYIMAFMEKDTAVKHALNGKKAYVRKRSRERERERDRERERERGRERERDR